MTRFERQLLHWAAAESRAGYRVIGERVEFSGAVLQPGQFFGWRYVGTVESVTDGALATMVARLSGYCHDEKP